MPRSRKPRPDAATPDGRRSNAAKAAPRGGPAKGGGARGKTTKSAPEGVLYGIHAVRAALDNPKRRIELLLATRNAAERLGPHATKARLATSDEIDALVGDGAVHQGVALKAAPLPSPGLEDVLGARRVAVLDQITDPQNLGAILRSAAAFGIEAVILTDRHAPPLSGTVAKTASGGLEAVPVVRVTNLARALDTLKSNGFAAIGLAGETETSLADAASGYPKLALVLGAEGAGLRRLTREACDALGRIPMTGAVESLNVSAAAAIAFHLVSRVGAD